MFDSITSLIFSQKPVIYIYPIKPSESWRNAQYMNIIYSGDNEYHSFRCPNRRCGKAVKIGFPKCPFCGSRLKWKYPFEKHVIK